jgi:hypothetical protein
MSSGSKILPETGVPTYPNVASFPPAGSAGNGSLAIDLATNILYESDGTNWLVISNPAFAVAITGLSGDVMATGPGIAPATVLSVGGASAADIATSVGATQSATSANTPSTIVARDGSGDFSAGIITANLIGDASGSAASFTGSLAGDVTGTQSATAVALVGGQSASNVALATIAANAATATNTPSTIVKRDGSGNFAAGTITASLIGNASTATNFTGSLVGDVTGTQGATVVSSVGGSSASAVNSATIAANAATNANTASTIVKRDASGDFSAGTITASLTGHASLDAALSGAAFSGAISATNLSGTNTGDITLANVDAAPNAQGASLSGQVLTLQPANASFPGVLLAADWSTFNAKANLASPDFTGVPTAPTATVGTNTTQLATTAFVLGQGFITGTGSMTVSNASSTTVVTSATTTYVTAISTTITVTASSAPIHAIATAHFTTTVAAATVMKYRVSINGVAGQEQLLTLTALATNYTAAVQYISASLTPGTYTVLFEFARNSGTGTVNFIEGTLDVVALQGAGSAGITQLTGDVTAGPGSGSQVATIAAGAITNAKVAAGAAISYSKLETLGTGQILAGNAGVPTATTLSGDATIGATGVLTIANLAVTNAKIANATINLTTKVTGTLPFANGGTGNTAFAASRIPFSDGTKFVADALFIYTTANTRFIVGQGGGTGRINGTVSTTDPTPNDLAGNFFSRATTNSCVNIQNENTLPTLDMTNSGGTTVGANILAEASRGTLPSRTQSVAGDTLFSITAHGRTASAWSTGFAATIAVVTTDTVTDTTNGGEIVFSTTANSGTTPVERLRIKQSGETTLVNSHLKSTQTTAPTIAADAGAGTGATASLARATDVAGEITINTGTLGLSTGSYATITFNKTYNVAPIVVLTPASSTLSTSVYVTATTTTFSVNFAIAGGIASTYVLNYHVIETQ